MPGSESTGVVQVERGTVLASRLSSSLNSSAINRLTVLSAFGELSSIAVVDACGHHRPVYRPLLVYCWLLAHEISPVPTWTEGLRRWCVMLRGLLAALAADDRLPASDGAVITGAVWSALAVFVAGEIFDQAEWRDAGRDALLGVCRRQQGSGAFLQTTAGDNPETFWYHELILLHAVSSFAVRSGDRVALLASERSAAFHENETQPDHATAQPWGLPAFVRCAPMLADQVLHTIATQQPAGSDGVSLMLLADTLYGLEDN